MAQKRKKRNKTREACWRKHMRRSRESGVTIREYCAKHDIKESAFYWWRRELNRRDAAEQETRTPPTANNPSPKLETAPVSFAQLVIPKEGTSNSQSHITVVLSQGREIRINPGFDETTFTRVVTLLEGVSC